MIFNSNGKVSAQILSKDSIPKREEVKADTTKVIVAKDEKKPEKAPRRSKAKGKKED